jgi:hypothetical protein
MKRSSSEMRRLRVLSCLRGGAGAPGARGITKASL